MESNLVDQVMATLFGNPAGLLQFLKATKLTRPHGQITFDPASYLESTKLLLRALETSTSQSMIVQRMCAQAIESNAKCRPVPQDGDNHPMQLNFAQLFLKDVVCFTCGSTLSTGPAYCCTDCVVFQCDMCADMDSLARDEREQLNSKLVEIILGQQGDVELCESALNAILLLGVPISEGNESLFLSKLIGSEFFQDDRLGLLTLLNLYQVRHCISPEIATQVCAIVLNIANKRFNEDAVCGVAVALLSFIFTFESPLAESILLSDSLKPTRTDATIYSVGDQTRLLAVQAIQCYCENPRLAISALELLVTISRLTMDVSYLINLKVSSTIARLLRFCSKELDVCMSTMTLLRTVLHLSDLPVMQILGDSEVDKAKPEKASFRRVCGTCTYLNDDTTQTCAICENPLEAIAEAIASVNREAGMLAGSPCSSLERPRPIPSAPKASQVELGMSSILTDLLLDVVSQHSESLTLANSAFDCLRYLWTHDESLVNKLVPKLSNLFQTVQSPLSEVVGQAIVEIASSTGAVADETLVPLLLDQWLRIIETGITELPITIVTALVGLASRQDKDVDTFWTDKACGLVLLAFIGEDLADDSQKAELVLTLLNIMVRDIGTTTLEDKADEDALSLLAKAFIALFNRFPSIDTPSPREGTAGATTVQATTLSLAARFLHAGGSLGPNLQRNFRAANLPLIMSVKRYDSTYLADLGNILLSLVPEQSSELTDALALVELVTRQFRQLAASRSKDLILDLAEGLNLLCALVLRLCNHHGRPIATPNLVQVVGNIVFLLDAESPSPVAELSERLTMELAKTVQQAPVPEARTCTICLDKEPNRASTVCGHIFCEDCAKSLVANRQTCPLCRVPFTAYIQVYV